MKIAFVLLDAQVTGGQVVAHQLMQAARAAGHDVLAIFPKDGPMRSRLADDGIANVVIPLERTYRLDHALRLARLLRRERVDVIDTHTLFVGNQLSRLAGRLARIPLVAHVHIRERYSSRPRAAAAQRVVDTLTRRWCAAFVTVSRQLRDELVRSGVDESRVHVVHNGVTIGPVPLHDEHDFLRAICIARLAPVKGQDVLLRAIAATGAGVELELVGSELEGDRPYREALERLADGLAVRFLGYRDDSRDLLAAADVCVLPSHDEGLPLVVLEAMERGCAVVATAVGGTPEAVVDGATGLLVPPGDAAALAAALATLRDDPALCARLGAAGRARIEAEFNLEVAGRRTLAILEGAGTG